MSCTKSTCTTRGFVCLSDACFCLLFFLGCKIHSLDRVADLKQSWCSCYVIQSSLWRHLAQDQVNRCVASSLFSLFLFSLFQVSYHVATGDRIVSTALTLREKELETEAKFNALSLEYPNSTSVMLMYAQYLADIKCDEAKASYLELQCENAGHRDEADRLFVERQERRHNLDELGKVTAGGAVLLMASD